MAAMVQEMIGTGIHGGHGGHGDNGDTGIDTSGLDVEAYDYGAADESQPTVQFKGFMQLKNEDKSGVILCSHLSQLARMAPSFDAVGYGMSETTEAADLSLIHI